MTRLKGYCPTCNGPLHRQGAGDRFACRLCWLERSGGIGDGVRFWAPASRNHFDGEAWYRDCRARSAAAAATWSVAEANSTENTAATSDWLPAVLVRLAAHYDDHAYANGDGRWVPEEETRERPVDFRGIDPAGRSHERMRIAATLAPLLREAA